MRVENGTAYYGNELRYASVKNLDECVAICSSEPECAGFDLVWDVQPNQCYMKVKMEKSSIKASNAAVHLINCRGDITFFCQNS